MGAARRHFRIPEPVDTPGSAAIAHASSSGRLASMSSLVRGDRDSSQSQLT
jgi:hypothetical protein